MFSRYAGRERGKRENVRGETMRAEENRREQNRRKKMKNRERKRRRRRAARRKFFRTAGSVLFGAVILAGLVIAGKAAIEGFGGLSAEKLAKQGYPESLITLLEKNPETEDFVRGYADYKGLEEIDLSGEVKEGEIPLFLQWDKRWGYETYGSDFLAVTGCGPTCLSMVVCGLTGESEWNPLKVAQMAEEQGFYVEGAGSSWDLMTAGAEQLGLIVSDVVFDEQHIKAVLEEGKPIICVVRAGDFTEGGHFLVLTGVDEDGRILLHDPNSIIRTEESWEPQRLMRQIKNLWAYSV